MIKAALLLVTTIGYLLGSAGTFKLCAQDSLPPWEGGLTGSIGQPSHTKFYAGATAGADWRLEGTRTRAPIGYGLFGVRRPLMTPALGLAAVSAEAYVGMRSTQTDAGVRALMNLSIFRLWFGAEYAVRAKQLGGMLGLTIPVRRGGVFGSGSLMRVEARAGEVSALRASVLVPINDPIAGRTRPRAYRVEIAPLARRSELSIPETPGLQQPLENVRIAARRIGELVVPFIDGPGSNPRKALAPVIATLRRPPPLPRVTGAGLQVEGVVRAYHREMTRAFSIAASGRQLTDSMITREGEKAAAEARRVLRDHVLYPYDRLLGQWKTANSMAALTAYARGDFARVIISDLHLPADRENAVFYVFDRVLQAVVDVEKQQRENWEDSRLIWLPLQLALRPEDHDTQVELDKIVESVVGMRFTDGNRVTYLINEEFQAQVIQSIDSTQSYHVVWIHDFRGRNDEGLPDVLSVRFVIDAYLHALTRHVRAYDQVGRIPIFMIFIDELYYDQNRARMWLDILENPLRPAARLPDASKEIAHAIAVAQRELATAVASSRLLQAEVKQYGNAWLRNLVKVHINVTNPSDQSFWSRQVMPVIGVPDNLMRDHRKIVFYDISEDNPYAGRAMYTGMGIGEHYAGEGWEDRSIMVQGPAVLSLKSQARRLLETQGLPPHRIPYPLRPRPLAAGYQDSVNAEIARIRAAGNRDQRAAELHNQTGFLDKQVSVAKATLYTLMPPGSVIKVPDSLWGGSLFAALLTGSALRGCRVLFVAPSLAAAPSAGAPQMAAAHALFTRLIILQQEFGSELEAAGGMLKTGIYNPGIGVQDIGARFYTAYQNGRRTPFLRRLLPIDTTVDSLLLRAKEMFPTSKASGTFRSPRELMPKLHLKANFFATREAWDSLVARPEWWGVLGAYLTELSEGTKTVEEHSGMNALNAASQQLLTAFHAWQQPQDSVHNVYYLLIGSTNADYRSMMLDGEASVLLSGWSGVVGLIDFGLIMALSVWIDDTEMLDALLPPPTGVMRSLARWMRYGL